MCADNTSIKGSPTYEEQGGTTRVAITADHEQQQNDPEVYPTTPREFVAQAPQEEEEDKAVVTIDPLNGQQIMYGPATCPPPNLPVMVCNDEGNAKLVLGDSIDWPGETQKGTFLIGSGNRMMRYPPKEHHVFTFKELGGNSNGEENLASVAGKPPI